MTPRSARQVHLAFRGCEVGSSLPTNASPPRLPRSGSLGYPAPSSAFTVSGWPSRCSVGSRAACSGEQCGRPSWSRLLFSAPVRSGSSPIASPGIRRAAAMRHLAPSPSIDLPLGVHSHRPPTCRHASLPASATRAPPSPIPFRPRGFSPPRRLPPPRARRVPGRSPIVIPKRPEVAGLLHPAADPGVRRVSRSAGSHRIPKDPLASRCSRSPRRLSPLEGAPSLAAVPRHRGLLPSWRCATFPLGLRGVPFPVHPPRPRAHAALASRALLRDRVLLRPRRFRWWAPSPSWALLPSEVLLAPRPSRGRRRRTRDRGVNLDRTPELRSDLAPRSGDREAGASRRGAPP
jgi:hypothetical protein